MTSSPIDRLFSHLDQALRVSFAPAPAAERSRPGADAPEAELDEHERRDVAGLMRINHTGEVCAQALYAGQAATARTAGVRAEMQQAADEEVDHLSWCADRLRELDARPSRLNPLWYAGSFAIGALAGAAGDRWSLGFVEATERQVEAHLESHLDRLPAADERSRAIVTQMKIDEARHAELAHQAGAARLPRPVQGLMAVTADLMKAVAYRV
ncbi:2-polyprenyl-3-methyl-6-methoxy-1,4-benzoquinone monooxygenase [Wenzhouxiangella sp. XN79A]|uniref:2-polyprenyl-3-methyl-6-methoxy-1,4-benzoquinone monooxygenase n=1 Tax=Wenzhouxiangella sp. XN79A TaxID=2724193 RepID=UPI00321646E2